MSWAFVTQQVIVGALWVWVVWAFWQTIREFRELEDERS